MSLWSGVKGLFSSAAPVASAVDPSAAPAINAVNQVVNALGGSSSVAAAAPVAPLPPTQAQLNAAMEAVVSAQNAYNQLLAQQKAVAAYNAAMQSVATEAVIQIQAPPSSQA